MTSSNVRRTTTDSRKVTVTLPATELQDSLAISGQGPTETIRAALDEYRRKWAYQRLLDLKGTTRIDEAELRWMTGKDDEG